MSSFDKFPTNVSSLANGAILATMNIPNCYTTTIGFWVKIGARNEPADKMAITHLIEHLWCGCFRNGQGQTLWEIARGYGGSSNGETSMETTGCWITVPGQHTLEAIDNLVSITINPDFSDDDVFKEAHVVAEELSEDLDDPVSIAIDEMKKAWGNNAIGRSDFLAIDILPSISKKDVLDYYQQNYVFSNMIIAIAGNVNHTEIVKEISQLLPQEKQTYSPHSVKRPNYQRINTSEKFMGEHTSLLHIATNGVPLSDNRHWALDCLGLILCSAELQTRLWNLLREQGLSYSPDASACYYYDAGMFNVFVPFTDNKRQYIEKEILKQMKGMTQLRNEEIIWAKEQLKTQLLTSLLGSDDAAYYLFGSIYYHGEVPKISELIQQIDNVNLHGVETLAEEIMKDDLISVVRILPER